MRESWTDDRLDHLSNRMDERFDRVDERFHDVDRRFERVEEGLREQRVEINALRTSIETRFDTTQYMIIRVGAAMFATTFIGFLSLLLARA